MSPDKPRNPDAVEALLRIGGHRAAPPVHARERVWAATLATWQRSEARRRNRRIGGWLAAAASIVVAVGALILLRPATGPAPAIAALDRSIGPLEVVERGGAWQPVPPRADLALAPGTSLRTQTGGRAGLTMEQGVSVRLAESTQVELVDASEIRLVRGVVYVDTGPGGQAGRMQVATATATFEDFGTQFEIRYGDAGVRLRVREGQVVIAREGDRLLARAEEQVDIDPQGSIRRSDFPRADPSWAWIEAVSPAAPTEGQTLAALVQWVARETGRPARYAEPAVEQEAISTILHGRLSGLTPLETLDVMIATTGLTYSIGEDEIILVSRRFD